MTAPKPIEVRVTRAAMPLLVFPWESAGALRNLVQGEMFRPDWVAVVPNHFTRPAWIPKLATAHAMKNNETAFTWRDEDAR